MKTLTIRLNKDDLLRTEKVIQDSVECTINGAIRHALKQAIEYTELKKHLSDLFISTYTINPQKLKELNAQFGILQGRFDW